MGRVAQEKTRFDILQLLLVEIGEKREKETIIQKIQLFSFLVFHRNGRVIVFFLFVLKPQVVICVRCSDLFSKRDNVIPSMISILSARTSTLQSVEMYFNIKFIYQTNCSS